MTMSFRTARIRLLGAPMLVLAVGAAACSGPDAEQPSETTPATVETTGQDPAAPSSAPTVEPSVGEPPVAPSGDPSGEPSSQPSEDAGAAPTPQQQAAPNAVKGEGGAQFTGPYLHPESITPREVDEVGPHTIVNRTNALPADWEPDQLVGVEGVAKGISSEMLLAPEAARAWEELRGAAAADGIELRLNAAYRSHEQQQQTWDRYEAKDPEYVMVYTAAPGRSEHQMGLAVDIAGQPTFPEPVDSNEQGAWLMEHAADHGWILRYPQGRERETGYRYESWHWRWVGKDLAQHLAATDQTMEQWAGLVR